MRGVILQYFSKDARHPNTTGAKDSTVKDSGQRRVSLGESADAQKTATRKKVLQEQKEELESHIGFLLSFVTTDPTVKVRYDARMKKYDNVSKASWSSWRRIAL